MINTMPASKLNKYKNSDEKFIYSVEGTLKQMFFYDALYSFFPCGYFNCVPYTIYEMSTNCIFAVTDKRIMVFETDSHGNIVDKCIYSHNLNEVIIEFKKRLGKRVFIIEKRKKSYFNPVDNFITVEIDSGNISKAENIYSVISENYIKKQGS